MRKRILALTLTLVLLIGVLATPASAATGKEVFNYLKSIAQEGDYDSDSDWYYSSFQVGSNVYYGIVYLVSQNYIEATIFNSSGLTLILPARIPVCAGALVRLAASWNAPEETPWGKKTRLAFLAAAAGMVFLAMAVMFLTWTSDTRRIIQGVQGRYFIPAIPVTAAALGLPLRPRSPIPAWIPCALMTLIHCDAIRFIVIYTLAH